MIVWTLQIEHKFGSDTWVFSDEEKALSRLARWAREWWHSDASIGEPAPTDGEIVGDYFSKMEIEMSDAIEALARKMCDEDAAYDDGIPQSEGYHLDWDNSDPTRQKYWLDRAKNITVRWQSRDNVSMLGI